MNLNFKINDMNVKEIIYQHLTDMAKKDDNFKTCFEDKAKNIDDCLNYILGQAKKEATHNAAVIEDSVVFGWAAHYYQEKDIKPEKAIVAEIKTSSDKVIPAPQTKEKEAVKKPVMVEGSLFNF